MKKRTLGNRPTLVGIIVAVLGICAMFFVPEVRELLGLDGNSEDTIVGSITQEGTFKVLEFGAHDIYYPRPFSLPPNLSFGDYVTNPGHFRVVEQRADGFRYEVESSFTRGVEVSWKAVGVAE